MSACRIEETDLPGYYYCTEHRVEMGRRDEWCRVAGLEFRVAYWRDIADDRRRAIDLRDQALAAHADEITALRAELADLVERLLGAP
jgi:hypothetical protein